MPNPVTLNNFIVNRSEGNMTATEEEEKEVMAEADVVEDEHEQEGEDSLQPSISGLAAPTSSGSSTSSTPW